MVNRSFILQLGSYLDISHSHLLVTRPAKSRALECFIVEIAQQSTHIALIVSFLFHSANFPLLNPELDLLVHASVIERLFHSS
jgi:hypothetical protein